MFSNVAEAADLPEIATNRSQRRPGAVPIRRQTGRVGVREPPAPGPSAESGAMLQRDAHSPTPARKGFHDATARATYTSRFRPIALRAVAAGTRQASPALKQHDEARRAELPGVLRHGFCD